MPEKTFTNYSWDYKYKGITFTFDYKFDIDHLEETHIGNSRFSINGPFQDLFLCVDISINPLTSEEAYARLEDYFFEWISHLIPEPKKKKSKKTK